MNDEGEIVKWNIPRSCVKYVILEPIKPATTTMRVVEVWDSYHRCLRYVEEGRCYSSPYYKRTTSEPFDVEILE